LQLAIRAGMVVCSVASQTGEGPSMVAPRKAILFGVYIWVTAFAVAFAIFPLRESSRPLFESIMPVVLASATVVFAHRYFKHVRDGFRREGVLLGLVWLATNVLIDLPVMLSPSPMQMTVGQYIRDIGLTYVMIPIITAGMGLVRAEGESGSLGVDAATI
jgi:hypothetical protein